MWRFLERVNQKHRLQLDGYSGLYKWSTDDTALFWEEVWHFVGIRASKSFDKVGIGHMSCCSMSSILIIAVGYIAYSLLQSGFMYCPVTTTSAAVSTL